MNTYVLSDLFKASFYFGFKFPEYIKLRYQLIKFLMYPFNFSNILVLDLLIKITIQAANLWSWKYFFKIEMKQIVSLNSYHFFPILMSL